MTAHQRTDIAIIFIALCFGMILGYYQGKGAADRYYAEQYGVIQLTGTTSSYATKTAPIDPCSIALAEHQEKPWCMDHDNVKWPARIGKDGAVSCYAADKPQVTLIPPQKLRAPEPVASLEEPTPPPQKKQKAKKECEDDNLNSFSNGFAQYKCAGGKWVVDDEAMKSLAKMETHKHELQWQLQTCVLGEESMKEVQSYGPMLFAPGSMQQYFQEDVDRRFNGALGLQNQLRAEHAASCQAKQPVASIEEPK